MAKRIAPGQGTLRSVRPDVPENPESGRDQGRTREGERPSRGAHEPASTRGEQPLRGGARYPAALGLEAAVEDTTDEEYQLLRSAHQELDQLLVVLAERHRALAQATAARKAPLEERRGSLADLRVAELEAEAQVEQLVRRASHQAATLWTLCGDALGEAVGLQVWQRLSDIYEDLATPEDRFELIRCVGWALASRPTAARDLADLLAGAQLRGDPVAYVRDVAVLAELKALSSEALQTLGRLANARAPDGRPKFEPAAVLNSSAPVAVFDCLARASNLPMTEALALRAERVHQPGLEPSASLRRKLRGCAGEAAAQLLLNADSMLQSTLESQKRTRGTIVDLVVGSGASGRRVGVAEVKNFRPEVWDRMAGLIALEGGAEQGRRRGMHAALANVDLQALQWLQDVARQLARQLASPENPRRIVLLVAIGAAHREWVGPNGEALDRRALLERRETLTRVVLRQVEAALEAQGSSLDGAWLVDVRPVPDYLAEHCEHALRELLGIGGGPEPDPIGWPVDD